MNEVSDIALAGMLLWMHSLDTYRNQTIFEVVFPF